MAPFNPPVPTSPIPDYSGSVGKPISDVVADKSVGMALSGAASLLDSSVKFADTVTKSAIQEDVTGGVDRLRDAYTDSLKALRNTQIAAADPANSTLLPNEGATPPPPGLQNGLERVKQIGTAIAQNGSSGKINDTLYTGALNSLAKQLRNSYPGYRDYIDDQIKSVSGVDPANAFMRNLMEDINKNVEEGKVDRNATITLGRKLVEDGFHDVNGVSAAQMTEAFKKGIITSDQFNKWVNSAKSIEYDLKQKATARSDRQADDADAAKTTSKDLSNATGKILDQAWNTMTIGKNTDTPAKLFDFIQKNAGNQGVTDERSRAVGEQLRSMRTAMFNQAWVEATKGGPNSMIAKMGGDAEAAKKVIESRLAPMDLAIQDVFKGDWGAAYSHANFNKAIASDTSNLLVNAPDAVVRKYHRMAVAISQSSPQAGAEFMKNSLLGGVPQAEKEYLKNVKMELLTQPDQEMGSLVSANGQIQKMKAAGATSPKTYSDFIDTVGLIADKNWAMENRINLARGFFDPVGNAGLLSDKNFKKDQIINGRQVPGKYSVFTKLSAPDVATSISEIAKVRPDIGKDYDTMMTREFGEQLFSRELKDLGQENADTTISKGYKIAYVSDKGQVPRFEIVNLDNRPMTDAEAIAVRAPVSAKNRLNSGITGLYTVYASTGHSDPSSSVLNTMYQYGYQEANSVSSPQGPTGAASDLPKMIYNSLISAQQDRLRKAGEAMKKAREQ